MNRVFEAIFTRLLIESRKTNFLLENDEECKQEGYWGSGGAGMLFVCTEDRTILLLMRASWVDQPGVWGNPGGAIGEDWSETPLPPEKQINNENIFKMAAIRETKEECGSLPPYFKMSQIKKSVSYEDCGFEYRTYICDISIEQKSKWTPHLVSSDKETDEFKWFNVDELPTNIHFGVRYMLPSALSLFS